jgi:hypothetical protein
MTEIVGDGIDGKRLWMRTPDDRWIPAPTGAGEDPVVRSINVWDGDKWLVVSDPRPFYSASNTHLEMPSLQLYAPGRYWTLGVYNPTYTSHFVSTARPWTPMHDDWVRFYHLAPRVNPEWRTVQLYDFYPASEVSAVGNQGFSVPFYPRGVSYRSETERTRGAGVATTFTVDHKSYASSANFGPSVVDFTDNWCNAYVARYSPDGTEYGPYNNVNPQPTDVLARDEFESALIDLKAIRRRLAADFAERDPHFNRQYDSINLMQIKRVIVHLDVVISATATGKAVSAATLGAGWCNINVHYGAASTLVSDWGTRELEGGPYELQRPNSVTSSIGTTIFSETAADWATSENTYYIPPRAGFRQFHSEGGAQIFHSFENPGEDNITFFVDTAVPAAAGGGEAITSTSMRVSTRLHSVSVHYVLPGKDVPEVYWYPEANGYGTEFHGQLP